MVCIQIVVGTDGRRQNGFPASLFVFVPIHLQSTASTEHALSARIYTGYITTPQGQLRDESQNIPGLFHGGKPPVVAVTTVGHHPGNKGCSRERREEDDGCEGGTVQERIVADCGQGVGESQGSESYAATEGALAYCVNFWGECEGGERCAATERIRSNCFEIFWECERGK